ncbi:carboxymuconolactone decarboxylase family protein [Microbispora sp. H13382]|uniref:carboxymuconolactone decarboxylase family protein n=1 Tax=Microbispora sp. H13382 TaxID=2729112 RepID=UPI001601E7A7|nr:carboxymuconolactone decarboxylase family protein [Microbispora sp. H13382]
MIDRSHRLPPPREEELTPEQRRAVEVIASGPRGALIGPFAPLLRSPELMTRLQKVGEFLRFESTLPPAVLELAILLVARRWNQGFEWAFHRPLALRAGIAADVVDAVAVGRRPDDLPARLAVTWDLVDELQRTGEVGDATYERAHGELGETVLVELVTTVGYYTTLAMIMNVAGTPAPEEG